MHIKILRTTKSICPVCLEYLEAFVIEKENGVFLSKACLNHGKFEILLSETPEFYKRLENFYFEVMDEEKQIFEYEIWATMKCNLECTICHLGSKAQIKKIDEPSCDEIADFLKKTRAPFYVLSGGEPTCRDDLSLVLETFKKQRKAVTIHTNGLKLVNIEYLNNLRKSGLDRVNLQFDGFEKKAYIAFRNMDLLEAKLKALENLKTLNMPTDFNITIAKNVNENAVIDTINFAAKNNFIHGINFFTICYLGETRNWPLENYIMPDQVVDILEKETNHKITKRNVYLFQKLHLAIKSLLKQRFCLYNQIYILVRKNNSFDPIDRYLNLERIEPWLDRYQSLYKKNKFLAKTLLLTILPIFLFRWESFNIIHELALTALSYFLKTPHYLKSKGFLYLSFATGCDPYKIDYSLVRNCQDEIIYSDDKSGKLKNQGRDGLHCIESERRHLARKSREGA